MHFLVPPDLRVLDLGCGTGDLLATLRPSKGVGVDFSERMINIASSKYPKLNFITADVEDSSSSMTRVHSISSFCSIQLDCLMIVKLP